MFLSTIQLMSFNTDYDKSFMQKIHELTERWRKQIVGTFLFDGAFRVQENKTRLEAKAKRYTRCFKSANELMADNGEKIKTLTPRMIELNRL
jgi:hypothetical protein